MGIEVGKQYSIETVEDGVKVYVATCVYISPFKELRPNLLVYSLHNTPEMYSVWVADDELFELSTPSNSKEQEIAALHKMLDDVAKVYTELQQQNEKMTMVVQNLMRNRG